MEYPAMLYKPGSMFLWDGEMFDYVIVNDDDEFAAAQVDGWVAHKPTADEEEAVFVKEPARRGRPRKVQAEG